MNIFAWWRGWSNGRSSGLALFKRGLASASHHENDPDAIEHYTAAIDTTDVPQDIKAMALYNRALLHAGQKDFAMAIADLNAVLDIPAPLRQIKSAARQKLDRITHAPNVSPRGVDALAT